MLPIDASAYGSWIAAVRGLRLPRLSLLPAEERGRSRLASLRETQQRQNPRRLTQATFVRERKPAGLPWNLFFGQ